MARSPLSLLALGALLMFQGTDAASVSLQKFEDVSRFSRGLRVSDLNKAKARDARQKNGAVFLAQTDAVIESFAHAQNTMHATQYYGEIQVGAQKFKVIFDSGSGHLLVPGKKCDSSACTDVKNRVLYDPKQSVKTSMPIGWADEPTKRVEEDSDDRDVKSISFAMGEVTGEYYRDQICLAKGFCGLADFVVMTEESDDPFREAVWDGVLGLGQELSDTKEFNVLSQLFEQMGGDKEAAKKEKEFSDNVEKGIVATNKNVVASSSQIYSYYVHNFGGQISFGKHEVFGKVQKGKLNRFHYVDVSVPGYWQFDLEDITIGGKPTGLCKQFPNKKCQAVVDTGSSLLMGPGNLIASVTRQLDIDDKCRKKDIPSLGFLVKAKGSEEPVNMELQAEDYLDRDDKECFIAMMSVGDTGRGPLVVLGYPFLRNFYTTFDFEKKQLGFIDSKFVADGKKGGGDDGIQLKGIRPV